MKIPKSAKLFTKAFIYQFLHLYYYWWHNHFHRTRLLSPRNTFYRKRNLFILYLRHRNIKYLQKNYWLKNWQIQPTRRKLKKIFRKPTNLQLKILNSKRQLWNRLTFFKKPLCVLYINYLLKKSFSYRRKPIFYLPSRCVENDFRFLIYTYITHYPHPKFVYSKNILSNNWNFMYIYQWKLYY